MPDEQMEVEIALRDSISSGLRQVGREIDKITRAMKEGGDSGTDAFNRFGKGASEAKETFDKTKQSVSGLSGFMIGMSRGLMGATGVAAGFIAVGEALESFATKRLALRLLATDLGLTEQQISIMRRTLEKMGIDFGEQNNIISSFGQKLKDVFRLGEYSPLITELNKMSEYDFAAKLKEMTKSGKDFYQVMGAAATEYGRLVAAGKTQAASEFARILGIHESVLQLWLETNKGVEAGHIAHFEHSAEYKRRALEISNFFKDWKNYLLDQAQGAFVALDEAAKKFDWRMRVIPVGPAQIPVPLPQLFAPKQMGTFGLEDEGALPPNKTLNSYVIEGMREEDKKTNRLLGEINDTLKVFESTARNRSGGGAQTSNAGLGTGLDLSGRPSGGGGGRSPGSGGSLPAPIGAPMGMPRSVQGAPGLSRFAQPPGAHSQSGSVLSQSQHAPIQTQQPMPEGAGRSVKGSWYGQAPGWVDKGDRPGSNALGVPESLQGIALPNRKTLGQWFDVTAPNGQTYRLQQTDVGPAKWTGKGIDISAAAAAGMGYTPKNFPTGKSFTYAPVEDGDQKTANKGIEAIKSIRSDRMAPAGTRPLGEGTSIITAPSGAKFRVATEFAPNFQGFLNDYEAEGGRIGPNSGGLSGRPGNASYHPLGRAIDVNQIGRNIRKGGVSLSVEQENEIARRHGLRPGSTFRSPDAGHFEVNSAEAARAAIDRTMKRQTAEQKKKVSIKGDFDFSDMPAASQKSGDELGKFKLLKVNMNPQGAKDSEGLLRPGDTSHTPYMP